MIAVCLGTFMLIIDVQIIVVAMPSIHSSLHTSFAQEQWTIDAYSISLAALLLPAGSSADILGRRLMFALGLAGFTLGSMLCGLATNGTELIVFRVLQGIGGAIVFSTSLAILAQSFSGRRFGAMLGIWGAVVNLGLGCGPVVGGLLTHFSWRWIFFVNLPFGIAAIVFTLMGVQEFKAPDAPRIDVLGGSLFAIGLVGLIAGLIESSSGWGRPVVISALGIAVVALVAFVAVERRTSQPMLDLSLFGKSTFCAGLLTGFSMNGSIYAVLLYLVLYLQSGLHHSALATGLELLAVTVAAMLTSVVGGRLSQRLPARVMVSTGLSLIGIGLLAMTGLSGSSHWTHLVPGMVIAGCGSGLINSPLAAIAVGVAAPEQAGMASGVNSAFRQIGMAVSVAILGAIFTRRLSDHPSAGSYASALNTVLVVAAALALAAAVLTFLLIRARDIRTPSSARA